MVYADSSLIKSYQRKLLRYCKLGDGTMLENFERPLAKNNRLREVWTFDGM